MSSLMRDVVQCGYMHEAGFVHPGLDLRGFVASLSHEQAVEEHAVFARLHAGDERGVVGPGDRGIRDRHRIGDDARGGELAEMRQRAEC